MLLTRRTLLAAAACLPALRLTPAAAGGNPTLGGRAFGSYWRLTLPDSRNAVAAEAAIRDVVDRVDRRMSPYRAGSDLSRFNTARSLRPLQLAPETARVARAALHIAEETGGAFDPTVGPLVARLGFGPIRDAGPGRFRDLTLHGTALRKTRADLSLDLCGIAKGHALDRIVAALDRLGIGSYFVELGGEVAARGAHPSGRPWRVAVEGGEGIATAVELADGAVATSGDTVQGYALGRRRYGHIVDPLRAGPADGGLSAVSVFDASATRADALATALFAMGRKRGPHFAAARGIEALFLPRGPAQPIATGGAASRLLTEVPG